MLFESLFQPLHPTATTQHAETHCCVRVPEGAVLTVQLGYKRPIAMQSGASLTAEVLVAEGARAPERVLHEVLAVEPMNVDGVRVPEARRVDLSHLAGRNITLVFRTERQGRVKLSPFILETYGMFWQNPAFENPGGAGSEP